MRRKICFNKNIGGFVKIIWIIIGAVVIAAVFAVGGFYGGMTYAQNQVTQVREQFFRERGGAPGNGQFPGGQMPAAMGTVFPGGASGFFGGNTTGEIKSIDGDTLTVTTLRNEVKATLSEATKIEKSQPGAASDLQIGQQVYIVGERDANGNISAAQIVIMPAGFNLGRNPLQATPGGTP
jgi:hypothetical protein